MTKTLTYAGIGSRETPEATLHDMQILGAHLAYHWTLRSGHADGADLAFEQGCKRNYYGQMEIYLPWAGFNKAPRGDARYITIDDVPMVQTAIAMAERFHPAWARLNEPVQRMMARNSCQVFGASMNDPVNMVICWTKDGKDQGGTAQAIRIARHHGIPIFNLAIEADHQKLIDFIEETEE